MIFNLFKNKKNWQHKDSNVRIAAINEELTLDHNEDKACLLALLNEDKSELVRRAVLLKLNSFDDYLTASKTNNHKAVQEFSIIQVQQILANKHKISLNLEQKQVFLNAALKNKSVDTSLFSYWLEYETEPTLISSLFELLVQKKNPSQFLLQLFTQKQSAEVQKKLLTFELPALNDASFLTKLNKKSANDEIAQMISDRLAQLIEQQEKPKRLLKNKQLILSKLLALRDLSDYGQYLDKKSALVSQWQQDLLAIDCLTEEEQQTLLTKYKKITTQLTQLFAPKEEAYQQAKIAEKLVDDKKIAKGDFAKVIGEFNQVITTAVFEDELLDQAAFSQQLSQLREKLNASVLNITEQGVFLKQLIQLEQRLTQLPEIAQSVSDATYLISNISQLALPHSLSELNDRQQTYDTWLSNWKKVDKKACSMLPQSIKDAHQQITQLWRNGLKPFQQEQKQLFAQTKKKLNDVNRLLASGKYKVCFGLFKGVSQALLLLSEQQQQQLQRDFDTVSEKIAEVSDWEHYIATPRKKELLTEIKALVVTPLDNPNVQADTVKQYRKTWNSLGHADEEIDKELNDQFNIACEQAFAPCRLFYAEQDKLREQHLVTRNKIIAEAVMLAQSLILDNAKVFSFDFKGLDGKLNKLQQRWQQAGDVDRQQYQKLLKQFKEVLQPVHKAIKDFHDANGANKQALIVKAEQQLEVDDIAQAIETIKTIQQQWRDIGFAGSHQEAKLWQKFRSVNDQVFAKRTQVKSAQQTELAQLAEDFTQKFNTIKECVANTTQNSTEKTSLVDAKEQADYLLSQVIAHKPVIKSVASAIEAFIKQTSAQIAQLNVIQENKSWQSLFNLLEKMTLNDFDASPEVLTNDTEYPHLTSFWQKRVIEQCELITQVSGDIRADKTLEIEILAQVESPAEFAQQRMVVQVSLMQEQMLSGIAIDLSQRFIDWLQLGKLQVSDFAQLVRLKKVFIKQ